MTVKRDKYRSTGVTSIFQQELLPRHKNCRLPSTLKDAVGPLMGSPESLDILIACPFLTPARRENLTYIPFLHYHWEKQNSCFQL